VIAEPFYSGAAILTVKFLTERPAVAKRVVAVLDEATALVNKDFDKYKTVIPKYTAVKDDQLTLLAKPYLRGFTDINDTDIKSYQALVDVFIKEGVMAGPLDVKDKLLRPADLK
jgi:NitT/TauT family transport system substrate-binding protein